MKQKLFALVLLAMLAPAAAVQAAEPISSVYQGTEDALISGEVITVWENTFLLEDASAQVVVSVAPYRIEDLGLEGRDVVSLAGRLDNGVFKPIMLVSEKTGSVSFTSGPMLDPLPAALVQKNSDKYLMPGTR